MACLGAHHLRYSLSQKGGPGISSPASRACEGDLQHKGLSRSRSSSLDGVRPAFRSLARRGHSWQLWAAQRQLSGAACRITDSACGRQAVPRPETGQQHNSNSKPHAEQQRCASCSSVYSTSSGGSPVQQCGHHKLTLGWYPACGRWTRGLHAQWPRGRLQPDTKEVSFQIAKWGLVSKGPALQAQCFRQAPCIISAWALEDPMPWLLQAAALHSGGRRALALQVSNTTTSESLTV